MLPRLETHQLGHFQSSRDARQGYAHDRYPQSLAAFGTPILLGRSGAWLLARQLVGGTQDAMGAYPFLACDDYHALAADLADYSTQFVSVGFVPDPFSTPSPEVLHRLFDVVIPFKTHYLADLEIPFARYLHRHHRRYAKRALDCVSVRVCDDPGRFAQEWVRLYEELIARHAIAGIQAFGQHALVSQLAVPGRYYFRATHEDEPVGALVCYLDRGVAYAHLIATTKKGQGLRAQYALYHEAIEHFRGLARWFALGSTPGAVDARPGNGLALFKAGWATATCQAHFCGSILDSREYERLCSVFGRTPHGHFPAYRIPRYPSAGQRPASDEFQSK